MVNINKILLRHYLIDPVLISSKGVQDVKINGANQSQYLEVKGDEK